MKSLALDNPGVLQECCGIAPLDLYRIGCTLRALGHGPTLRFMFDPDIYTYNSEWSDRLATRSIN